MSDGRIQVLRRLVAAVWALRGLAGLRTAPEIQWLGTSGFGRVVYAAVTGQPLDADKLVGIMEMEMLERLSDGELPADGFDSDGWGHIVPTVVRHEPIARGRGHGGD